MEDFAPSAEEQELYDDVSEYLRREDAAAIPQARRQLFALVYRKLLASSTYAIAPTLDRLADTLDEKRREASSAPPQARPARARGWTQFAEEGEELVDEPGASARPKGQAALRRMNDELSELGQYARLARRASR